MKRIGCLIPFTNYTVEQEIQYLFNSGFLSCEDVCFHFARLKTATRYSENEQKFLAQLNLAIDDAIEQLSPLILDYHAFFCTAAKTNKETDISCRCSITAIDALLNACRAVSLQQCMIITPYTEEIGDDIANQISGIGVKICSAVHLNLRHSIDFVNYGIYKLYDYIMQTYEPQYGAVVILCTNLPTYHLVEQVEANIKAPVITSNQSIIWSILSELRIPHKDDGLGVLLRTSL